MVTESAQAAEDQTTLTQRTGQSEIVKVVNL